MAGSISLSLSQQFNELGKPLAGGLLYFYAAGTTTPQDAFKDSNLTLQHPNPITLDAAIPGLVCTVVSVVAAIALGAVIF